NEDVERRQYAYPEEGEEEGNDGRPTWTQETRSRTKAARTTSLDFLIRGFILSSGPICVEGSFRKSGTCSDDIGNTSSSCGIQGLELRGSHCNPTYTHYHPEELDKRLYSHESVRVCIR